MALLPTLECNSKPFLLREFYAKGALRSYGASLSLETEFASLSNTELRKLLWYP